MLNRIPKIRKLDLYITTEILAPLLGGVAFFCFVFLMFQVLRLAEYLIVHDVPIHILGKMMALMSISFLPMVTPVAFLIAILIAFGRLSTDSELVALKASGVSIWRMISPALGMALVIAILSLALNLEWVPRSERMFKSLLIKLGNTKVASSLKEGTFTSGFFDLLIFADKVDTKTNKLQRVFIYDERKKKTPLAVVAKEGRLLPVKSGTELGSSVVLDLQNGNIHRNDLEAEKYQKINFEDYRLFLKIDEGQDTSTVKPKMYPYGELKRSIRVMDPSDPGRRQLQTELWRRYAVALSPLIFVFLGAGFGTIRTRAVRSSAFLVAFVVILVYWGSQTWATTRAYDGMIPPWFAMQIPNILIGLLAWAGFRKATW